MGTTTVLALVTGALLLGAALGAAVAAAWARVHRAALAAERDLLRDRLADAGRESGREDALALALAPLTSGLARLERHVNDLERHRSEQLGRLDAQLGVVHASGEALRRETSALAGALRSPNARGAWGEVQLRRVVEHAGMLARVDFDVQVTATGPDGVTVRPDAVVRLPGGKHVVVDAKAPLAAFLAASETTDGGDPGATERRRAEACRRHAAALRAHVDALAAKRYWEAFTPAPELVVCFVPGEAALAAACAEDPALLEHALGRRVVLATPTTLLTLLRTVAMTWQQDALAGSARELFELGRELHHRLATLGRHAEKLGRGLHRAVEDYNALVGTLERRVLVSARRMADLGLVDESLPAPEPVTAGPRPLSAPELLDPELLDPELDPDGLHPDRLHPDDLHAGRRDCAGVDPDGAPRDQRAS